MATETPPRPYAADILDAIERQEKVSVLHPKPALGDDLVTVLRHDVKQLLAALEYVAANVPGADTALGFTNGLTSSK